MQFIDLWLVWEYNHPLPAFESTWICLFMFWKRLDKSLGRPNQWPCPLPRWSYGPALLQKVFETWFLRFSTRMKLGLLCIVERIESKDAKQGVGIISAKNIVWFVCGLCVVCVSHETSRDTSSRVFDSFLPLSFPFITNCFNKEWR